MLLKRNLGLAFLLCCSGLVFAADATPEEVLKSKGLVKIGAIYELDGDVNVAAASRTWKAAQAKYNEGMHRRSNLEGDIRATRATLEKLADQNEVETNKLNHLQKEAYASYNRQVDVVNGIRNKLREGVKVLEQREKTLDGLDDPTTEYSATLQKVSLALDATTHQYDVLAADADVKAALDQINKTVKPPVHLGPTQAFKDEVAKVRYQCKQFVSASINFDVIGGVPHVPVMLNDSVKSEMVVDSGAAMVLLTADTAKQLGVDQPQPKERKEKFVTADGTVVEGRVVTLASVRVGAFTVENVEAGLLPEGSKGSDDLLGGTFLRHFVYKMDLAGGVIHLTQIPDQNATLPKAPQAEKPAETAKRPDLDRLVIEAFIDGNAELHITSDGLYWKERGVDKPGLHDGHNDPTYVNGQAWQPVWGVPEKRRGNDQSDVLKLPIGKRTYDVDVLAISEQRGNNLMEKRDPVTIATKDDEQVVIVPDRQNGARWYTIELMVTAGK